MNDISSRLRHVLIPTRLFGPFQRRIRCQTDRDVEFMGIVFGKDYEDAKKVNRTICIVMAADENQLIEASLHYNETILHVFILHIVVICSVDCYL